MKQKHQGKKRFSKPPNKKGRIIVRNIPFKTTEESLRKHFASFGKIREVNLLRRPDGNPVGCGFIQFNNEDDAAHAIETCSGKDFMGRSIVVELAMQQAYYIVNRPDTDSKVKDDECGEEDELIKEMKSETEDETAGDRLGNSQEVTTVDSTEAHTESLRKRKRQREKGNKEKKGRIIVRNLPFKITEAALKKHFSEFGELSEVTLLRKPDGKMVGCGFIQFTDKKNGAKAIVECSGKPLLGRPIVLDWAVPKSVYNVKNELEQEVKVKEEPLDVDDIKIEDDIDGMGSVKSESNTDSESEENPEMDGGVEDDDDDNDITEEPVTKRPRVISNDVSEGRTVFAKNVPFSATNVDLKKWMEQFGPVLYALICVDRFTEHSKGTAFIKFKTLESAKACLSAGTELTLHGQVLDCQEALNRDEVQAKSKNKADKKAPKDSRNLYLVKEGVVLAGSKSAAEVSVTDMSKRLQLEQWKSQMLRNLNMFVARDRLAVHNLPPSYDDEKLRALFQKHSRPNAFIREAKVMRDMRNVDINGIGKSKETGFVKFTTHEDALHALRKINNNPNIFTKSKRPIVAFSIENRAIHKVKQQREQKSRAKNPTFAKQNDQQAIVSSKKLFNKEKKIKQKLKKQMQTEDVESGEYTGVAGMPGNTKLRTKYNLKTQASLHTQTVRNDKKKKRSSNKLEKQQKIQREIIKQPKQKQGGRRIHMTEDESFSKLVNKYKTKIESSSVQRKWYDT